MSGLRIGLTGGIGSGKSTVARCLVDCGAMLIDADAVSRSLTAAGGAALPALASAFGAELIGPDGALDRERMRRLAFEDPTTKARLEGILHPMIGAITQARADAAGGRTVVFDVPLLAESAHWRARVDRVLVVDCPEDTQVQRVMARSGWDAEGVRRVIAQQATRVHRRSIADAVVFNHGISTDALATEVQALWDHWHA